AELGLQSDGWGTKTERRSAEQRVARNDPSCLTVVRQGNGMNRLPIVIVNYRTPGLVIDCLRSLVEEVRTVPNARVYVVENASPDDSAAKIQDAIQKEGWSSWAELMTVDKNLGFAGGNNAALRPILAEEPYPD